MPTAVIWLSSARRAQPNSVGSLSFSARWPAQSQYGGGHTKKGKGKIDDAPPLPPSGQGQQEQEKKTLGRTEKVNHLVAVGIARAVLAKDAQVHGRLPNGVAVLGQGQVEGGVGDLLGLDAGLEGVGRLRGRDDGLGPERLGLLEDGDIEGHVVALGLVGPTERRVVLDDVALLEVVQVEGGGDARRRRRQRLFSLCVATATGCQQRSSILLGEDGGTHVW